MEPFSEFALAFLLYWVVAVMTLRNAAADFKKYTYTSFYILDVSGRMIENLTFFLSAFNLSYILFLPWTT